VLRDSPLNASLVHTAASVHPDLLKFHCGERSRFLTTQVSLFDAASAAFLYFTTLEMLVLGGSLC
jgi:hypothetical protein